MTTQRGLSELIKGKDKIETLRRPVRTLLARSSKSASASRAFPCRRSPRSTPIIAGTAATKVVGGQDKALSNQWNSSVRQ
jgi:hypothetical protein